MKKILVLVFVIMSIYSNAQTLVVTPNGLRDSSNIEKEYVVLNIENKTAKELYDNMMKYINLNYKNPKEVIKGSVESDFIKFDTYVGGFPLVKSIGVTMEMGTTYTILLSFQDNKIKFEIIDLVMKNRNGPMKAIFSGSAMSGYAIFNKSGELKREETKLDIENYFNNKIKSIIDAAYDKAKARKDW